MSSVGQGSISVSQKAPVIPAPGPPFPATSADNGLSVDPVTGRIVLGNDVGGLLAALLSDREIPMDGSLFRMSDGGLRMFEIDPANQFWGIGDLDNPINQNFLSIDAQSHLITMQSDDGLGSSGFFQMASDTASVSGSIQLSITSPSGTINYEADAINHDVSINDGGGMGFFFDFANDRFSFGDFVGTANGNAFQIDDTTNRFLFGNTATNAVINMNGVDGFTGTVTPVNSITVEGGIVTAVS